MTFDRRLDRTVETRDGEAFHLGAVANLLATLGHIPSIAIDRMEKAGIDISVVQQSDQGTSQGEIEEDAEVIFFPGI